MLLILLGSPNGDDGSLSPVALQKCRTGLEWLRQHAECALLATGGKGEHFNRTSRPHWHYVCEWFADQGIARARLLEGVDSYNTLDDAVFSRARLLRAGVDLGRVRVMTCAYHSVRARWIFDRVFAPERLELLVAPDPQSDPALDALAAHEPRSLRCHEERWEPLLEESLARLSPQTNERVGQGRGRGRARA